MYNRCMTTISVSSPAPRAVVSRAQIWNEQMLTITGQLRDAYARAIEQAPSKFSPDYKAWATRADAWAGTPASFTPRDSSLRFTPTPRILVAEFNLSPLAVSIELFGVLYIRRA